MNKMKLLFIAALISFSLIELNAQTVKIKEAIVTVDKFLEIRDKIATTPEGGAAIFLLALKVYTDDPKLGKQCLVIAVDQDNLQKGDIYKGFELLNPDMDYIKRQIIEKNRKLPNSYITGSSPENGYDAKLPYTFEFMSNPSSGDAASGTFKIFVKCSGDDSPRSLTLKKNNRGLWKASEWNSLLTGIKKPVADDKL